MSRTSSTSRAAMGAALAGVLTLSLAAGATLALGGLAWASPAGPTW
mgnify:CR=1 FL=1